MTLNLYNLEKLNIKIRQRKYNNLDMQLSCPVQTNFCLPTFRKVLLYTNNKIFNSSFINAGTLYYFFLETLKGFKNITY